jgi:hypothetical protein
MRIHFQRLRIGMAATVAVLCAAGALPAVAPASETCPNEAFRVGPSANLPDCRAYEQVTPVEKNGGALLSSQIGQGVEGTPDLVLDSFASIAGIQDNYGIPGGWYSTARGGSGWTTSPMPPPASEYQTAQFAGGLQSFLAASLDARSSLWYERSNTQPEDRVDFDISRPGGVVEDVGPVTPPGTPPGEVNQIVNINGLGVSPAGESDDFSHILYRSTPVSGGYRFWPFDKTEEEVGAASLYEFVGTGNAAPMLVGVDDSGNLISRCRTEVGAEHASHNAMSGDGDTVFFTARACGSSPAVDELFARVDNGQPDAHTVAISEPSPVDCPACDTGTSVLRPAHFEGASVDGSKVFFTTSQPLLGGDTNSSEIYEYDFDALTGEKVVRVSDGDSTVANPSGQVEGVVQTSEDGSHVYFVAKGVLTTTPNSQGQMAREGANNLYVFERDARHPAGSNAFIAALAGSDKELWSGKAPADVTPDGRFIVFTSTTDHLTTDDTSTAAQVFEYDAQTDALVRVSIGQNGYNDNGNTDVAGASINSPGFAEANSDPTKYWSGLTMSTDGAYVFFQSSDGLAPQALNHEAIGEPSGSEELYATNVYEYHEGNVYLISDGRDVGRKGAYLIGTGASGADVLFTTVDQLAPQDTDTNRDIYDARIDGGFPAPVAPAECSGDACQGPLSPAPVLLSPGSEFQAPGAVLAPPVSKVVVKKAKAKPKRKAKPVRKGRPQRKGKHSKKGAAAKRGATLGRAASGRGHVHGNGGWS